eukprot:1146846-Pelagomonas_calceolata.AAC.3
MDGVAAPFQNHHSSQRDSIEGCHGLLITESGSHLRVWWGRMLWLPALHLRSEVNSTKEAVAASSTKSNQTRGHGILILHKKKYAQSQRLTNNECCKSTASNPCYFGALTQLRLLRVEIIYLQQTPSKCSRAIFISTVFSF